MEMEYEQSRREFFRHSLFGGSSTDVVEHEVYTIHLSDINNSYRCEFEALGQPLICGSIPPVCPRSLLEGSEELDVSDLMRDHIEVLIGADIAGRLLTDDQRRISSGLVAIRTKLGWTVMGKIPPTEVRDDISSLCVTTLLSLDLENLWKLDAIGVSDAEVEKKTQSLQAEMEEHFAHTTTRDIEGRYEVALPWVQDKERIPSNKDLAENQLRSVRRKLEEVGDMKEYGQIFEEWMKQGIIEYAREDKLDGVHYLPHRPVYKRNSQTSRIRPVFNASARKRDKAPEHLKITAEQLKSSFYVDNCLSSFQNVEETEKFVKESTELLSTACFNLRDWDSYVEKTTLHIFCDASQFAYATCIFLRIEKEDRVDIQLIQARTRVAPLKKLTIPRLELLACLIGARLAANVIQDLEFEEIPRFYWTDSTNALCWIQREDNWAAFVMNRVKEIHNLSSPESWRHIPGRLNPADLPSRGCSAESLKETRWWEGPAWLKVSQEEWPKSTIIPDLEIVYSERRKTILNTLCTTRENENLFGRYSHFLRIVRITAWIYRFFNNAKIDRRKIISEDLSTEEITKSEIILIRLIQRESFSGHEDKKLQGFKLLVDSSGILRIKTKICRREDFANFRMPILLPSDHFLVSLLIRWNHETHGHAGLQTLLGILRENYWILRSRKTVKKIINQCIRCKRFTATPATVESTSLPEDRVRDAAVFEIVGVDLTGHLILKNKKKAWIVIFTCAVYRGVHLELVTSLSMEAFLQAFRRFIARRGRPLIVYSDNGTNFKGIANALKKIDFSRLKCDPTLKNITWKFIPPGAPWWGGWWERLIGMMKQLLFRILGQTSLGYEELSTVMCDVESLMNTRPLTYLTEESEDLAPLTPSLFLHEVREVGVPDLDLIDNQTLSRKYQYIKRVREDLRERFRIEYFGFLRQETRRLKTTIPLKLRTAHQETQPIGSTELFLPMFESSRRQLKVWMCVQSMLSVLGEEKVQDLINFCLSYMSKLKLPVKRGNFIEFRTGLINVCPVGRSCSQAEREAFNAYDNRQRDLSTISGYGNINPGQWLKEYERVSKYNRWDDTMKLANVVFYLNGTAGRWFDNNEEISGVRVIIVRKKDGTWRFCVDYRRLNKITKKDVYPLPHIDDALDSLTGSSYFSTMDLRSGYWQIEVDEKDREKTAFITPDGLYEFQVMPFGLCIAPATFERMIDSVLGSLKWNMCLCYLDDIVVYAPTFEEHLRRLQLVLRCIKKAGLSLNHKKCLFGSRRIKILGHLVDANGIHPDPDKVEAVSKFPRPKNTSELRSLLGLCSYYRRFIENFADKARSLHDLLKTEKQFYWDAAQEKAFEVLKTALISEPVLGHVDESADTHLHTDASGHGIGAVLLQIQGGKERPIAYASRSLTKAEHTILQQKKNALL
ncbi:hypothetical protein LAZ67_18001244 [Cordylochernes scorpioides]|uniref:Uncharacterized protein n=1 Tax=Cordylochernes scorpioides TaxID=51811 RepID=A0ABY6LGI4_9ARAC|nr:hypothetical protein LAZ67_18001244 [Cordylochernes scorpioides]